MAKLIKKAKKGEEGEEGEEGEGVKKETKGGKVAEQDEDKGKRENEDRRQWLCLRLFVCICKRP